MATTTFPPTTVTWTDPIERFTPIVNPGEAPPAGEVRQVVVGVWVTVNQTQADGTRNVTPQTAGKYLDNDSGQEVDQSVAFAWRTEWAAVAAANPTYSKALIQQTITGTQLTPIPIESAPPAPAPAVPTPANPIPPTPAQVTTDPALAQEKANRAHQIITALQSNTQVSSHGLLYELRTILHDLGHIFKL